MKIEAGSPDEYISKTPKDRQAPMHALRQSIRANLPAGFDERMSYGMIGYVVPHSLYPDGYHVSPALPLPFINIASQKNYIALYHSGLYSMPELQKWFIKEYSERTDLKLDMGKSCVRFKKVDKIPFDLIAELCAKVSPEQWIEVYESKLKAK